MYIIKNNEILVTHVYIQTSNNIHTYHSSIYQQYLYYFIHTQIYTHAIYLTRYLKSESRTFIQFSYLYH